MDLYGINKKQMKLNLSNRILLSIAICVLIYFRSSIYSWVVGIEWDAGLFIITWYIIAVLNASVLASPYIKKVNSVNLIPMTLGLSLLIPFLYKHLARLYHFINSLDADVEDLRKSTETK